jgi:hypothetical protein
MASQRALTLAEAAEQLRVTPQRISQMLRCGVLDGPEVPLGRAQKHAPRVWDSSLQQEITRRQETEHHTPHLRPTSGAGEVSKRQESDDQAGPSAREAAALEAALLMKLRLDEARKALREERQANKRLASMLAAVIAELQEAQAQADRLDDIAAGYSEALTQLLILNPASSLS